MNTFLNVAILAIPTAMVLHLAVCFVAKYGVWLRQGRTFRPSPQPSPSQGEGAGGYSIDMANIEITASASDIIAQLRAAGLAKLEDPQQLRILYKLWANAGELAAVTAYDSETSPSGQPWEALKPATLRHARNRNRKGTLRLTGAMSDRTIGQVTADGATVGSDLAVGAYSQLAIHQFGAPRAGIPARPVLPMDAQGEPLPSFVDEIEEITLDWLGL